MRMKLTDELKQGGWRSSILTTYSVDPAFYDRFVASRLRAYGCENNILLADAGMFERALQADAESFSGAGRRYTVTPVNVAGCFHPKVSLRLGVDKARILIGSANVTAAGWGHNQELTAALSWSRTAPEQALIAPLVRKTYDYLEGWLRQPGAALAYKLDLIGRQAPWLNDIEPNASPITLDDGTLADLFLEPGGGPLSTMSHFVRAIAGEKVRRLVVISPYWDADLSGFAALAASLGNPPAVVALNPERNAFPVAALSGSISVEFVSIKGQVGDRFVHAKLILAETEEHDHVLYGSANCSDDALGTLTIAARNAEASVYRRLPAGAVTEALAFDLSLPLDRSAILPPEKEPPAPVRSTAPPAGHVELDVDRLLWTPPAAVDPGGAEILLPSGERLPTVPSSGGTWRASLDAPPRAILVVRIIYSDGRASGPVIVNDLRALKRAAPGAYDKRLNAAMDRVLAGDGDLIDLALEAQALFSDAPALSSPPGAGRAGGDKQKKPEPSGDFATPGEFRAAVAASPATGVTGRFLTDDPGLQDILAIVLRGIAPIDSRIGDRLRSKSEYDDLEAGENEDGSDGETRSDEVPNLPTPPKVRAPLTLKDFEARRRKLDRVLEKFESNVELVASGVGPPSANLPMQSVFILKLMVDACRQPYDLENGSRATLMNLVHPANEDNARGFSVRAAKLLRALWRETPQGSPVSRLTNSAQFDRLPDDIFYLTAISRWAIVRSRLAVSSVVGLEKLDLIVAKAAAEVFRATTMIGSLDRDAEEEFVRRLDAALAFDAEETDQVLRECRTLLGAAAVPVLRA